MRLVDLQPQFLKKTDGGADDVDDVAQADGLRFKCPKCTALNHGDTVGVHSIVVWRYGRVPGVTWCFGDTGYETFELMATPDSEGKASIQIIGGCEAHFNIHGGNIVIANAPRVGGPSW